MDKTLILKIIDSANRGWWIRVLKVKKSQIGCKINWVGLFNE